MAFDPYHEWLGIPAEEQPPNHYRLLSIPQFENSPKVIETAADRQMGHLRNYQTGEHSALSQKLLNEVAAARVCLLNAEKRAAYDQKLRAQWKARQKAIPTAKPLDAEPVTKPVDPGLEQLFAKTDHAKPVGKTPAARNKQTQFWTITGIVAVGFLAVVFILIRVNSSSNDSPSTPGRSPVAQSDPPKPPPVAKPPEPSKPQPPEPVDSLPDPMPSPSQGEEPSPPAVTAPDPVPPPDTPVAQNPPTPESPAVKKPSRLSVPAEEDRAKIAAQLKDLFELDKDRTPEERKKLAGDLVELAAKSDKPAERYVLLVSAAQLDCQAGDGAAALRAVDTLAEAFDVDALALKASLIKKLAAEAGDSAAILAMLDAADAVIDAAMAQEKYDVALELVEEAYKACAQGTGRDHRKRAFDRRKQVQALSASWQQVQAALEKLKTTPDDPEANLAAGRYYCFDQGDWDKGLPCLAKSSDAELKKLAEEELSSPPADADAMLKLADAWWTLSEARQGSEREAMMLRAGTWYREAQPDVASTLVKAKVEKRLEEIEKLGLAIPKLSMEGSAPPIRAASDATKTSEHQPAPPREFTLHKTLVGHTSAVKAVAFSPDGSLLASAGHDKTVKLWSTDTWTEVRTLTGNTGGVLCLAFSPDGLTLAASGGSANIQLWNVATGEAGRTLKGHTNAVTAIAFRPDGKTLASAGGWDKSLQLWDVVTGEKRQTLKGEDRFVSAVAFSPDGSRLVSGHCGSSELPGSFVRLWQMSALDQPEWSVKYRANPAHFAFRPDGSVFACASLDRTVRLWDVATGKCVSEMEGHADQLRCVAYNPNGSLLASGGKDRTVRLWNSRGQLNQVLQGHEDTVTAVAFSPDCSLLGSASDDKTVKLWAAVEKK